MEHRDGRRSRHGHTAALIDLSHHVGGMLCGGLVNTDIGERNTVRGLAAEFFQRGVQHYEDNFGSASPRFELAPVLAGREPQRRI